MRTMSDLDSSRRHASREWMELQSQLLDSIGQAVMAADPDGGIIYWNKAAQALYGLSSGDVLGRNLIDVTPHVQRKGDSDSILRDLQRGKAWSGEVELRRTDGSTFIAAISDTPIVDEQGEVQAIIGVSSDISDRRRAERRQRELEEHFRIAAETIPDVLFTLTADGWLDYINGRFTDWTGLPVEAARGNGWMSVLHPEDARAAEQLWAAARKTGASIERKHRVRVEDGSYRWFITRARPIWNDAGEVERWFGTSTDVHDLVCAERAIQEMNATLEARVTKRTAQVRALSSALMLAEQRERHRVARLLHDHVQQLLYGLKLKAEVVGQDMRSGREKAEECFRQISSGFDEAIEAIESLTIELSPPVLHDEGLGRALEWLSRHAERKYGLEVDVTVDGECSVPDNDQCVLIFQFVRELLLNVVNHADVDRAEVHLRRRGEELHVDVIDRGSGFEPEKVTHGADDARGLFSIRERLRLFGGRMKVSSTPGHGTHITFATPLHPGSARV